MVRTSDVQWIKTVGHIVESCQKGESIIKPEILCAVTKKEEKIQEVCNIVAEWNNYTSTDAVYCSDQNLESFFQGFEKTDMEELLAFKPGACVDFKTSIELNEWIHRNQKIQESLENKSIATKYLARLKKYQILEQMFSNQELFEEIQGIQKDRKTRLKWEYLLMKFAIDNHSLGIKILRFVEMPWSKFSTCSEFRKFIANEGLEFPRDTSKIVRIADEVPTENEYLCTQEFRFGLVDKDLWTLDKGKWLNDSIIAHHAAHLITKTSRKDIYFFHSTVFVLGSDKRTVPVENVFKTFAISVNLQNNHWALVLVCLELEKIFYIDSWPYNRKHQFYQDKKNIKNNGGVKAKSQKVLDKIVEKQQTIRNQVDAVLRTNGYVIEKFNWVECVMPVQENGSDCGVYVLKYLEDFLDNESELLDAWVKKKDMRKRYKEFSCYDYRNHVKSILG